MESVGPEIKVSEVKSTTRVLPPVATDILRMGGCAAGEVGGRLMDQQPRLICRPA
jgi:hypothetical protein